VFFTILSETWKLFGDISLLIIDVTIFVSFSGKRTLHQARSMTLLQTTRLLSFSLARFNYHYVLYLQFSASGPDYPLAWLKNRKKKPGQNTRRTKNLSFLCALCAGKISVGRPLSVNDRTPCNTAVPSLRIWQTVLYEPSSVFTAGVVLLSPWTNSGLNRAKLESRIHAEVGN